MSSHRIAGPNRAHFARGLIVDREDEIHHRCAGSGEFVPALAAQAACRQVKPFEQVEGEGMHHTFW
jgi:hypothetical protein